MKSVAMVLDDDPVFNLLVQGALKKMGFDAFVYENADKFIQDVVLRRPKIIFVDVNLNLEEEGFSVIESVRRTYDRELAIITVSATGGSDLVKKALEAGANDYLVKPLERDVLFSKVKRYCPTDALKESADTLLPESFVGASMNLRIHLSVESIRESGVTLLSSHALRSGTAVPISGRIPEEMKRDRPLLATIVTTEYDPVVGRYRSEAFFDPEDLELRSMIRKWLFLKEKKSQRARNATQTEE